MGGFFSRWRGYIHGQDPYYASYEKALSKIDEETRALEERMESRKQFRRRWKRACVGYGTLLLVPCAAWALPVLRSEVGTHTLEETAIRLIPLALLPLLAWFLYAVAMYISDWKERRDRKKLRTLREKQSSMVAELKDRTSYDKTQELLMRYDPDSRRQKERRPERPRGMPVAPSNSGAPPSKVLSPTGSALVERLTTALVGDGKAPALEAQNASLRARVEVLEARLRSLMEKDTSKSWEGPTRHDPIVTEGERPEQTSSLPPSEGTASTHPPEG